MGYCGCDLLLRGSNFKNTKTLKMIFCYNFKKLMTIWIVFKYGQRTQFGSHHHGQIDFIHCDVLRGLTQVTVQVEPSSSYPKPEHLPGAGIDSEFKNHNWAGALV